MKPKRNLPSSLPAVFFFWGSAAVVVAPAFPDHVVIMDNSHVLLDASTANICSKFLFVESDDRELAEAAIYTLQIGRAHV